MPAITYALNACLRRATGPALAAALALIVVAAPARAAAPFTAASAHPAPLPAAGWHGRPIRRPQARIDPAVLAKASYPALWRAGAVGYGTGYHRPGGSERVREVQRRLASLGYRTGPVDGLFGPLTRSSVEWFQIKHGLRPTGVVNAGTLAVLRRPHAAWRRVGSRATAPAPGPLPSRRRAVRRHAGSHWLMFLLLGLVALIALTAAAASLAAARRSLRDGGEHPPPRLLPPPRTTTSAEAPARPVAPELLVLGYVNTGRFEPVEPHIAAIAAACEREGWTLVRVVQDHRPKAGRASARPGLAYALDQLGSESVSRLVVNRFEHLGSSADELRAALGWFVRTGQRLTVLDMELDSVTAEGRKTLRSLAGTEPSSPRAGPAP